MPPGFLLKAHLYLQLPQGLAGRISFPSQELAWWLKRRLETHPSAPIPRTQPHCQRDRGVGCERRGLWWQPDWISIPILPLTSCVTLGWLFNFNRLTMCEMGIIRLPREVVVRTKCTIFLKHLVQSVLNMY